MKKILTLSLALVLAQIIVAQQPCKTYDELKVLPTTKPKLTSVHPVTARNKEQIALTKKIFTTTIEPALATTKGMAGNWSTTDYCNSSDLKHNLTDEKLIKYDITTGLNLLQCINNKVKKKYEPSVVASFGINYFVTDYIAYKAKHEENKVKGKNSTSETVYDTFNGQQLYYLNHNTTFGENGANIFYREDGDEKYFILCKPDVPIFIPLTVKQVLEICKKNALQTIEYTKATLIFAKPETRADYEKRMADEFATYRRSLPDAEKMITDMIKQLEDMKVAQKQQIQTQVDFHTNCVKNIDTYLNNATTKELNKEYYGSVGVTGSEFQTIEDVKRIMSAGASTDGYYFIFNPAYFNRTISNTAPQFITIKLKTQDSHPTTIQAFKDFEKNLDFEKLKSYIVK